MRRAPHHVRRPRRTRRGDALISPSVTRRLIAEFADRPDHTRRPDRRLVARDRSQVVVMAYEYGMLTPGRLTD